MLEVRHLTAFYGNSQALFDVRLSIGRGEMVTLLGRNGMGKTTTVNCIMGLLSSAEGVIEFDNRNLKGCASHQVAQSGIGIVPEGRGIFPNLTVDEQLHAFAAVRDSDLKTWTAQGVLELFPNLAKRRNSFGNQLSGGEQQMLAIGRALVTNPILLILDEATEGLAPLVRQEIWRCLEQLKREGLSILVIDKNVSDLARIADQHFIVEKGRTVWSGDSTALWADASISTRYLGL
jgi:branched-chain amino acid transport system ATP-binding protein